MMSDLIIKCFFLIFSFEIKLFGSIWCISCLDNCFDIDIKNILVTSPRVLVSFQKVSHIVQCDYKWFILIFVYTASSSCLNDLIPVDVPATGGEVLLGFF